MKIEDRKMGKKRKEKKRKEKKRRGRGRGGGRRWDESGKRKEEVERVKVKRI